MADAPVKRKRTFRKFSYRGVDLDQLLELSTDSFVELGHCRARRKFVRGIKGKPLNLLKRLRKSKQGLEEGEKPATVKTHLRNMIIVPEMIGSVCGVYNGKSFTTVEVKPEMVGMYLAEFSITYKPVGHGGAGIGGGAAARFI